MGKSRGKAIIDKAKGRNVEGFRFASEFLRGDRIICVHNGGGAPGGKTTRAIIPPLA